MACHTSVAFILLGGCGPAAPRVVRVVDAPATQPAAESTAPPPAARWPREWNGRALFESPHAMIYARSKRGAEEIADIITHAFRDMPGDALPGMRGVVLVSDNGDQPLLSDEQALMQLSARSRMAEWAAAQARSAARARNPATQPAATQPDSKPWAERRAELTRKGVPIDAMLMSMSFDIAAQWLAAPATVDAVHVLTLEVAAPGGTAPASRPGHATARLDGPTWAAAVPTKKLCKTMISDTLDAALKQPEVSLAQRIIAAPFLPLMESAAINELAAQRRTAVQLAMIDGQYNWSSERRESELARVREQADLDQARRLKFFEEKTKQSPPSSQPSAAAKSGEQHD